MTDESAARSRSASSEGRAAWSGALVGLACGALALGVAELIAGLRAGWRSPVFDVGDRVIDLAPASVTKVAIDWFGTNDKPALLIGIGLVLAGCAAAIGALAFVRHVAIGVAGMGLVGVIGAAAVVTKRTDPPLTAVTPVVVGVLVGAAALWSLWRLQRRVSASVGHDTAELSEAGESRRRLLIGVGAMSAAVALTGGAAAAIGRRIAGRFDVSASRAALRLPRPVEAAPAVPAAAVVDVDGVAPLFTPNADFYRIDTALSVPHVPVEDYTLRVTGMVERELSLSFDELVSREVIERDITLTCVSNTIGGELVGNARWLGARLDELLAEAGVDPAADQVIGRSVDGYTCGFPVEAATDGRDALVAFGMNGEPLPLEHGFPVRLVVPGLYGYVSATKWLTEIELTTFDAVDHYWVPRGYAVEAPIKVMSRIDSVDGLDTLTRDADGVVAIGGVAWAQTRGISSVEVQIDDGEWERAELGEALSADTWRQWAYRWAPATTGRTEIRCRAVDGDGVIQTADRAEPLPNGASGHHQIIVFVE